jgi:membrane associated rhomboid family serine protease
MNEQVSSSKPLLGADNNAMVALVVINLSMAAMVLFIRSVYFLEGHSYQSYLDDVFSKIVLHPATVAKYPWTVLSYNWVLSDYWTLFTNLFWLFVFGNILQSNGANKHIFPIYFYTGIVVALLYLIFPAGIAIMGAGFGVLSLAMAALISAPHYPLLGSNQKWITTQWLVVLYVGLVVFFNAKAPLSIQLCLLAAALSSLLYMFLLKRGVDLGKWMHQLLHLLNNSLAPKN